MNEKASRTILIGVAIGVLSTIGGKLLVDWIWSQPEAILTAKVSFAPIAMPPVLQARLAALEEIVKKDSKAIGSAADQLLEAIYSDQFISKISSGATPAEKDAAHKQLKKQIGELLTDKENIFRDCEILSPTGWMHETKELSKLHEMLSITGRLSGYLEIEIINQGSSKADEVSVDLPNASYAVVSRSLDDAEFVESPGTLSLGSLGPRQAVRVNSWMLSNLFIDHTAENLVIRHSKGLAKVDVTVPTPIFWNKVASVFRFAWFPIAIAFGFLLLMVWVVLKEHLDVRARVQSTSSGKTGEAPPVEKSDEAEKKGREQKKKQSSAKRPG
jgi:hypothetical protein